MNDIEVFEEKESKNLVTKGEKGIAFVVDLDGFEGPIDVLLMLAREHKLDLIQISILELADQYLSFVAEARQKNLELAADYLVMAAWLAFLKSRLLLPDIEGEDEPSGEEMAAALAFQLRRLEVMQESGQTLIERSCLGREFFGRGIPEKFRALINPVMEATLFDLLKAYGNQSRRMEGETLQIEPFEIHTVEEAIGRLRSLLGSSPDWESLWQFLPKTTMKGLIARSAIASTFAASLELVREGRVKIRQSGAFGHIYLKVADDKNGSNSMENRDE